MNKLLNRNNMTIERQGFYIQAFVVNMVITCMLHLTVNGSLTRYVKLRVAHAPGMPGTFSPPRLQRSPPVSDPGMHHGTCVTHVRWCMLGSLTRGGGENVPDIPGACATRNWTYLARGPCACVEDKIHHHAQCGLKRWKRSLQIIYRSWLLMT